ncbi:MAG TPA: hypothetical protein VMT44_01160 [Methanoregula sp.]|nr:hypothetical protein [Methanoregula sp.]
MKRVILFASLIALACIVTIAGAATTGGAPGSAVPASLPAASPQDAAALVYVSGYDLTPSVFYPYETGTLTVHVTNAGTSAVPVSQPDLIDPKVDVLNKGAFTTTTSIGPGATVDYNFIIQADGFDGTYFPLFTVSTNAWGTSAIHSQIKLKVDSTDVRASISMKPDTFSLEKTDSVNVSVVNPRLGDISDVLIVASSPGSNISPSEEFVQSIPAGSSVKVPFDITPHGESDVTFNVSFRNGDNVHTTSVVLPLNICADKSAAVPVINNVALTPTAGYYTMTADVGNAGITNAQGMIISVGAPAKPVEPYPAYTIGSLASDDFTRFTLTFAATDLSAVPVQVQWKDTEGNTRSSTTTLDLTTLADPPSGGARGAYGVPANRGGPIPFATLAAGGIIVIVCIALFAQRKWIASKLKKQ